jgi:hypothetical protein
MFGSQALETAIGFALIFFVIASAASAIVEVISRWLDKRSKDLDAAITGMFTADAPSEAAIQALNAFRMTSIYRTARLAAGRTVSKRMRNRHGPSYLSAKSFADAVTELISTHGMPVLDQCPPMKQRVTALVHEAGDDVLHLKAGLEAWFDETMERLQGAYKRWATAVLFVVGLGLAVIGNVSAVDLGDQLWRDPVTRQVAVDAAARDIAQHSTTAGTATTRIQQLPAVGLPIGWHDTNAWYSARSGLHERVVASHLLGWLLTAVLVMLGAPFWFDALSRLVSLRTAGPRPPASDQDSSSATSLRARGKPGSPAMSGELSRQLARLASGSTGPRTAPIPVPAPPGAPPPGARPGGPDAPPPHQPSFNQPLAPGSFPPPAPAPGTAPRYLPPPVPGPAPGVLPPPPPGTPPGDDPPPDPPPIYPPSAPKPGGSAPPTPPE